MRSSIFNLSLILRSYSAPTLNIRAFLSLPVPAAGWAEARHLHDEGFVAFVEERLAP